MAEPAPLTPGERKQRANELIAHMAPVSRQLTEERTALESRLIPVSAYIVTACIESFLRYPEMMRAIYAALPAEEIGRRARRPGCRVNTVYLWSIANFWLIGRKVYEQLDPGQAHDVDAAYTVLDFWDRAAQGFHGEGRRLAADSGFAAPYDPATVSALLAGVRPVSAPELRDRIKRFNATLVSYLFLLYFDTRVGAGDTGPYLLPDGRVLLVRDYYHLAESDFWWSSVARDVPYPNLTAALVLEGVSIDRVTDFGTSYTTPEDYLDHLVGFALYQPDPRTGALQPVPLDTLDDIVAPVRRAQSAHYRAIAAMSRDEKIACGAYVYFSFLRPFAEEAGIADQLDWTVPRDIPPPVYDFVSQMEGDNGGVTDEGPYYSPLP